jgi:Mg-chelatase subunit ChlD
LAPASRSEGDLDFDASFDALHLARATANPASLDELTVRAWKRPAMAICLLVDRSGSMHGRRLMSACVTAAACAWRAPSESSIIAFADEAWVMKSLLEHGSTEAQVHDLLRLRGHGVTNLALGLRAARRQLDQSRAARRVTILLSDCRETAGEDPTPAARAIDELIILAPEGDSGDAERMAAAAGARVTTLAGPFDAAAAVARVLDR